MNCQLGKPNGSARPGEVRPFQRPFRAVSAAPARLCLKQPPPRNGLARAAAPRRRPKGKSMSRKHGRPRAALTYVLASAALATAFTAGPAVMLTGTAAQAAAFVPACPTHHVDCI